MRNKKKSKKKRGRRFERKLAPSLHGLRGRLRERETGRKRISLPQSGQSGGDPGGALLQSVHHRAAFPGILILKNRAGDAKGGKAGAVSIQDGNGDAADSRSKFFVVKAVSLAPASLDFLQQSGLIGDRPGR